MSRSNWSVRPSKFAAAVTCAGLVAALGVAPVSAIALDVDQDAVAATATAQTADAPATTDAATTDAAQADVPATTDAAPATQDATTPDAGTAVDTSVACIGTTNYATFDEAVAAAKSGDTVTLLADAQTKGIDIATGKDLTVDGKGHALTFTDKGIALRENGHLTFKNVTASMTGVGATPAADFGWTWMSVCAQQGATLTLDGASLTMDGTNAGNTHAIYFCSNNKLNLKNGSNLTIKNYKQDALEWDGGDDGYNVNIEGGSTYTSDHNRSGFTGTFTTTVDASTVNVINSTGNGSNGSHFYIKNNSNVDFSNNGVHGLSAGNLSVVDSTVTANGNGYNGIIFTGKGEFKNANIQVTGTKGKSYWNAGIRLLKSGATLDVDAASTVSITGNQVTGLFLDAGSKATFAEDAKLTITGNDASQANCSSKVNLAQCGGGVVVRAGSSLTLPSAAVIDNNHAALAGDDLYVEKGGTISFGATHDDTLTEFDGCGHTITGWYEDGAKARWSAHGIKKSVVPAESGKFEGELALKAAHGLARVDYKFVGSTPTAAKLPSADEDLEFGSAYNAKAQGGVDGWTFDGWYTDEACTTKWVDGTALPGSMTLYGKWSENPKPAPKPKDTTKKTTKKDLPQTGDATNAAAPIAAAGAAVVVAGAALAKRRNRE